MMKKTRMNESHPHKTVICRMYVTRKSGKEKEKGSWSNSGADLLHQALVTAEAVSIGQALERAMALPAVWLCRQWAETSSEHGRLVLDC